MQSIQAQIVTYNSSETIEACLRSVLDQTIQIEAVLVYDNKSADDTVARIRSRFPQVTVIETGSNLGYSAAHNLGFCRLTSDFVLTLNPDAVLEPAYLERILHAAIDHPHVGAYTGKLLSISVDENGKRTIDTTGIVMKRSRRAFDRLQGEVDDIAGDKLSSEVFAVSGAAAVYRKSMLQEIAIVNECNENEYLDEGFFAYKEDIDLCWRAQLLGWKCLYVDSAVGYHERGWKLGKRNRKQIKPFVRMHSMKNRYLMMLKNDSPSFREWIAILAVETAMFGYGLLLDWQLFKSYWHVWRLLKKMLRKRRIIRDKIKRKFGKIERIHFSE